jgi:hypothetical protein
MATRTWVAVRAVRQEEAYLPMSTAFAAYAYYVALLIVLVVLVLALRRKEEE